MGGPRKISPVERGVLLLAAPLLAPSWLRLSLQKDSPAPQSLSCSPDSPELHKGKTEKVEGGEGAAVTISSLPMKNLPPPPGDLRGTGLGCRGGLEARWWARAHLTPPLPQSSVNRALSTTSLWLFVFLF